LGGKRAVGDILAFFCFLVLEVSERGLVFDKRVVRARFFRSSVAVFVDVDEGLRSGEMELEYIDQLQETVWPEVIGTDFI
jgi:hypothetical protein